MYDTFWMQLENSFLLHSKTAHPKVRRSIVEDYKSVVVAGFSWGGSAITEQALLST